MRLQGTRPQSSRIRACLFGRYSTSRFAAVLFFANASSDKRGVDLNLVNAYLQTWRVSKSTVRALRNSKRTICLTRKRMSFPGVAASAATVETSYEIVIAFLYIFGVNRFCFTGVIYVSAFLVATQLWGIWILLGEHYKCPLPKKTKPREIRIAPVIFRFIDSTFFSYE